MKRLLVRQISLSLSLGVLLLHEIALGGCSLRDTKVQATEQKTTIYKGISPANGIQSVAFTVYPYPSGELWQRLKQVIKMPPDQLTHRKLGDTFGLEFDERKILWYGDKESRKFFSLSTRDIKNFADFPFDEISLFNATPSERTGMRSSRFAFNLFAPTQDQQLLLALSERYCIKPKRSDMEALDYVYEESRSTMPPPTDRYGVPVRLPYREEVFVDDLKNRFREEAAVKEIRLKVLPNDCLVGVSSFAIFR